MAINQTIYHILEERAKQTPDATAILAPDRSPLTYQALSLHLTETVTQLRARGINRNDRVALVLPNGPEMATTFLAVAAGATSAPLNPTYRANEFDFYLSDLQAKAIIIHADLNSPAREVARSRGIPIIELLPKLDAAAGLFTLMEIEANPPSTIDFAQPDDVALVLHTSGTTSRPKIVPLTQINLSTSSHNITNTLALTERDRCLNVMPLFHIHGLMAATLASLTAGASLVCTPGFHSDKFFEWLDAFQPTWYTAVPTMHQLILTNAEANQSIVDKSSLRFIRSSSASLPPQVMLGLENTFKAPVIESYGMTEASHQMTSNPLPPGERKPGMVGLAAGPEVAIMSETDVLLSTGQEGEIVIRGANVTLGYENNPMANQTAFTEGWFRTGDLGVIDDAGYLSIVGRLKEIVNRGGEKIAPREVEEAFLNHPAVVEAAAFAVPHATLGEDLAVAVVTRRPEMVTEKDLRRFAFVHLTDFKVPSRVLIVDKIPKGPTGKLQRSNLAKTLAEKFTSTYIPPRNTLETSLTKIWAEHLGLEQVGIYDNFFSLGGDSLMAGGVLVEMEKLVNKKLQPAILFRAPSIEQLASVLQDDSVSDPSYLVPIQVEGDNTPLFCVPGHGGDIFTFLEMARCLGANQPVYVFRFPDKAADDDEIANAMVEVLAESFVQEMRAVQQEGPYRLIGFCYGGEVAFSMAHHLHAQGQQAELVGIIYAYLSGSIRKRRPNFQQRIHNRLEKFRQQSVAETALYLFKFIPNKIRMILGKRRAQPKQKTNSNVQHPPHLRHYPGQLVLINPINEISDKFEVDPYMGWGSWADEIDLYDVPGDKSTIFQEPHVQVLAERVKDLLRKVDNA